jgi:hypothetical protein
LFDCWHDSASLVRSLCTARGERDEALVDQWLKTEDPRINALRREKAEIFFDGAPTFAQIITRGAVGARRAKRSSSKPLGSP